MALPTGSQRVRSNSLVKRRSVKPATKRWQPPEGLAPRGDRRDYRRRGDGARSSAAHYALGDRRAHQRSVAAASARHPPPGLVLSNLKNPSRLVKTAQLSRAHAGLPGDLLVWARENGLDDDEPLFFSRQRVADGRRKAIDRVRAWQIVKSASERQTSACWPQAMAGVGEPAPVHPHLLRLARVRQIVRHTQSLARPKQAGWARLHTEYLTLSNEEANALMQVVPE
jgi:hypothetical protein